jgi:DNA-binding winged helix-turn-helix (wHTH) protein/tetratricopeptide (TPR) repeat protein
LSYGYLSVSIPAEGCVIYRFAGFELNQEQRELRCSGRQVELQPRVFDLLLYLIARRDRVVTRDELLAQVWEGVVVTDGSLKRAVSLLRTALRQGGAGAEEAVRTLARQGYRFCAEDVQEVAFAPSANAGASDTLARARRAHAEDRWTDAAEAFAAADAGEALEALDLERWAEVEQFAGRPLNAVAPLERAVAAHAAAGDRRGTARAALGLATIHYERLQISVGRGWLQHARRALGEGESREHGLAAAIEARFALGDGLFVATIEHARCAVAIGRQLEDLDVELLGMNYVAMALIASGDTASGIAIHEETGARALGGTAHHWVVGMVYCGIVWSCRNCGDWQRAAEWAESFLRWYRQNALETFAGNCRLHHAEVLQHRGDFDAAEREAAAACEMLAKYAPYAVGDGSRILGDLRLARGDLDGAERAFWSAHENGWDPQPGLALVMLARGQASGALRALERALESSSWSHRQRRALLLASTVTVALAADVPERARRALAELEETFGAAATSAVDALLRQARAEIQAHEGQRQAAIASRREAIERWHRAGSPFQVARNRVELAKLFTLDGDAEAARLEIHAARPQLERLGATGLLAELDRLSA